MLEKEFNATIFWKFMQRYNAAKAEATMSGTESPNFDQAAESHQVLQEARQDRDEIKRLRQDRGDCQMVMDGQRAEIDMLRAALKEIQAYSVGDPRPRHTWYYDRAEAALSHKR